MKIEYRNIELSDIDQLKEFTDCWIGRGHYDKVELREALLKCSNEESNVAFLALDGKRIVGLIMTYLPNTWNDERNLVKHTSPDKWECNFEEAAYIKHIYVDDDYQGEGIGTELCKRSLEALYKLNTKAVVTHAWVQSLKYSTHKFLNRLKFQKVGVKHDNFWFYKNYFCPRCAPEICTCHGIEYIFYFPGL